MCDQTEVTYSPGDVVWVKLGPVWWPGQVQDYDKLPEEITHDLRKRPIAVVKFFQEDSYEYVKNLNQIYHYNCRKKEEFIKKGLDMVRSSNTREVPSNMSMFPNDIVMAEHITGGDPNILESEAFAPEQKTNYSELFGSAKKSTGKKGKTESLKKEFRRHSESPIRNNRKSLSNLPKTIPRPITHPRFISKALEGKSDHEVRIRCQISVPKDEEEKCDGDSEKKKYKCHLCDFQSARLNVIVLHNKSHSAGFIEAQNAVKAKLKTRERERISLGPISLSEQTPPTSVTSRGRVKSLPKKLLDYTDEPPPKMLKEKSYSRQAKEESSESPDENSTVKTPKKQKSVSEKTNIKRPLFGKRKSAKEKAELAAKLKQENEAMKETLLKDWDDDDVNEEEVELERLKQALESTTTSSIDDETEGSPKETVTVGKEKSPDKRKEQLPKKGNKVEDDVKSKVFEFDDSEDSLPVNINFRNKNKPEKFTDDKFKKPKPPKPLSKPKSKSPSLLIPPPPLFNENKDEDKETADLNEAFNALLEETSVPVLPDIPTTSVNINKSLSDQTSDISSSTDLINDNDKSGESNPKMSLDDVTSEANIVNSDLQMECTSSDNEDINTSEKSDINNMEMVDIGDNQKNMMEVSAVPSAETDSEVISSGDATTTSANLSSNVESHPVVEEILCGDSTMTEITSTCDGSKAFEEKIMDENDVPNDTNIENKTDSIHTDSAKSSSQVIDSNTDEKVETHPEFCENDDRLVNDASLFNINTGLKFDTESKANETSKTVTSQLSLSLELDKPQNSLVKSQLTSEEIVKDIDHQDTVKTEKVESELEVKEKPQSQEEVLQQSTNIQIIVPSSTDPNTSTYQEVETMLVPKLETQDQEKVENKMSQSLQDMELDINSMPVIIGGEDFIPQEQPNPELTPIQPKYTESIVISPKCNISTTPKPESVIVHLSEPSSSTQNVQSVISLPSKGKGGGRGGRAAKTTSKTIKLSASALKNLGSLQKGGNQQVLILKTASSKDSQDKGSLQKTQGPLNLIQHGNKILIVNNPQMSGQNKIKLNPQQQQLLTGGKLAPGTRVFTSKVVATTSPTSKDTNKTSTSKSLSKPTQKLVISKGGLLSNVSKSVIINSSQASGKIISAVPGLQNITTSKGQTIITQNILNTKGGLILPSSSQNVSSSNKTTTIITSQSLPSSKGMILTPIASKGGQIISGNQKLRIVSSKAPLSGTKFLVQSSQGKTATVDAQQKGQQIKLIRGQPSGNTILIQTSQGLVAKSLSPSSVTATTTKTISPVLPKTVASSLPSPAKIRVSASPSQKPIVIQQSQPSKPVVQQIVQQPVNIQPAPTVKKVTVQKVRQSPNILQKPPRKSTPRGSRGGGSRAKNQSASKTSEPLILPTTTSLPVINQPTLVPAQIPQNSEGLLYLTIDESGNYRQVDSKSLLTLDGNSTEGPRTIYIPASSQPQDVSNVYITIDDAGMTQLVNIPPPTSTTTFTPENPPPQDILAKALANTQVFQQETIIPDVDVTSALASSVDSSALASATFVDQSQYPAPSLSHSVQETSLTLTQPIMTPLEVPSNVSPSLGQISALPSNYITANLINTKQKNIHPSMPLLSEESLAGQAQGEPVFLLDSSNNIIPLTSGSQTSFTLTLDDSSMVAMSSGETVIPQTYQVVSGDLLTSQLITNQDAISLPKGDEASDSVKKEEETSEISSEETQASQQSGILREALEAPQSFKSESFLNSVEVTQSSDQAAKMIEESYRLANFESQDLHTEHVVDKDHKSEDVSMEEVQHSLKRSLGEEQTVTSSSDHQDEKRIRLEER